MGTPRLARTRLWVSMDDGATFELEAHNIDLVAFDRERHKRHWPAASEAPFVWLNFLAWHHLTKVSHELPECTLAEFERRATHVVALDDDDTEGVEVDPTNQGRELE